MIITLLEFLLVSNSYVSAIFLIAAFSVPLLLLVKGGRSR